MKSVTVQEVRNHLSKLLNEMDKGEQVILTRRGKQVAKLIQIDEPERVRVNLDYQVDWADWVKDQREWLDTMPMLEENPVLKEREGYRG